MPGIPLLINGNQDLVAAAALTMAEAHMELEHMHLELWNLKEELKEKEREGMGYTKLRDDVYERLEELYAERHTINPDQFDTDRAALCLQELALSSGQDESMAEWQRIKAEIEVLEARFARALAVFRQAHRPSRWD